MPHRGWELRGYRQLERPGSHTLIQARIAGEDPLIQILEFS
jgi:hypothetical protein